MAVPGQRRTKIHAESSSNSSSRPAFAQILVRSSEPPQFIFACFFIQKGSAGPAHLQDRRHDSVLQHQDSDPDSLE